MDQIKVGRFIAECRRAAGMTQREPADKLAISDKTVSKWKCGKGLPEVSLMLPLCETLGITVNELLTGERIDEICCKEQAEENMMNLIKEKQENRKKVILSALTCLAGILKKLDNRVVWWVFALPLNENASLSTDCDNR